MNQLFTVHSSGNIFVNNNSNSRNIIPIELPAKTTGYIYRANATAGTVGNGQPGQLFEALKSIAPSQIVMEAALAQFVVNQADGSGVDIFAFSSAPDANIFLRKQDNYLRPCWFNMGVISTAFATSKCLSPIVYLGFRNNNLATPINVQLEVVALVDTTAGSGITANYSYSIANGANQNARYLISMDKISWNPYEIRSGDVISLTHDQPKLSLRLVTSLFNMVTYDIQPGQRYRIIWSTANRWDLVTY